VQPNLKELFRANFDVTESTDHSDETPLQHSIYDELHQLAAQWLTHESPGHSLQPTMLANDAWMRLLEQRNVDPSDRSLMLAAGANIIRRLLVDYARRRKAQKRGGTEGRGNSLHVSLVDDAKTLDVLELNDLLDALARNFPRASQIVELRFFGGMTGEEIAEQLSVSLRTVNNDWRFAKAWLYRELRPEQEDQWNDE
jgi:RNA polymerase sigma-70 factor (ECF subfamily)